MIAGVVLAAGEGRRFGGGKQLAPLEGRPLVEHALEAAEAAGLEPRLLVLGANAEQIINAIELHGHEVVLCVGWREGLAASLRAGVTAAQAEGADAILITLGDQPRVGPEAIARILAARGGPDGTSGAIRATYGGVPGHPTLLEGELFDAVHDLSGDEGARGLFESADTHFVPCDDIAIPTDVDEVGDLAALSASPTEVEPPASEADEPPATAVDEPPITDEPAAPAEPEPAAVPAEEPAGIDTNGGSTQIVTGLKGTLSRNRPAIGAVVLAVAVLAGWRARRRRR